MSWANLIMLDKDEKIVHGWEGTREIIERIITEQTAKKDDFIEVVELRDGVLVLTTKRLVFLEAIEADPEILDPTIDIPIIDLTEVYMNQMPFEDSEDTKTNLTHIFRLRDVHNKKEFREFKKLIGKYQRVKQSSTESQKSVHQVT